MIPLIFAVSIMVFPGMIANFLASSSRDWVRNLAADLQRFFSPNSFQYNLIYFLMVVASPTSTRWWSSSSRRSRRTCSGRARSFRACGPGKNTAIYLQRVLTPDHAGRARSSLGLVAILPFIASQITGIKTLLMSATSLLIVVGVAIDTMRQLEAQLMMRNYEGFIQ